MTGFDRDFIGQGFDWVNAEVTKFLEEAVFLLVDPTESHFVQFIEYIEAPGGWG